MRRRIERLYEEYPEAIPEYGYPATEPGIGDADFKDSQPTEKEIDAK